MPATHFHKEDIRGCASLIKQAKDRSFIAVKFLPKSTKEPVTALRAFVQVAFSLRDAGDKDRLLLFKESWRSALVAAPPISIPATWFSVLRATSEVFRVFKIDPKEGELFFAALEEEMSIGVCAPKESIDRIEDGMATIGRMFARVVGASDEKGIEACGQVARAMFKTEVLVHFEDNVRKWNRLPLAQEVCEESGMQKEQLLAGKVSPELTVLLKKQIQEIRTMYRTHERSLVLLPLGVSRAARVIAAVYEAKLDRIVALRYDVFHGARKPSLMMRVLVAARLWVRMRG